MNNMSVLRLIKAMQPPQHRLESKTPRFLLPTTDKYTVNIPTSKVSPPQSLAHRPLPVTKTVSCLFKLLISLTIMFEYARLGSHGNIAPVYLLFGAGTIEGLEVEACLYFLTYVGSMWTVHVNMSIGKRQVSDFLTTHYK